MPAGKVSLIASIRGPVVLITLGSLIMLDYSGGASFWRTWPVLLIVIGLLKLIEHIASREASGTTQP
jgi:hypothetical protein